MKGNGKQSKLSISNQSSYLTLSIFSTYGKFRHNRSIWRNLAIKSAPTILFVDDSPVARQLFKRLLETRGYRVTGAVDGWEALALVSEKNFDVVIADLHLRSDLNGMDVLREIEKVRPHKSKILVTATGPMDVESSVKALGGACITKPVNIEELVACIRTFPTPTE
jgi:DNA-binding response OmpR family regulator